MSTLTIRLPDDKHLRLRKLAKHRAISVNKLIEELATISIAEFDAETRFRTLAARGWSGRGGKTARDECSPKQNLSATLPTHPNAKSDSRF